MNKSKKLQRMYAGYWNRRMREVERNHLLRLLSDNDHNGTYLDSDCDLEGLPRLTLEQARQLAKDQGL